MKRKITAILVIIVSLICISNSTNVMAATKTEKNNLKTIVKKLNKEGTQYGGGKMIQKYYYDSDYDYTVSVSYVESLESLRFMAEQSYNGMKYTSAMDYNFSDYSASIFYVALPSYNMYYTDDKVDMKTIETDNVRFNWKGTGGSSPSISDEALSDYFAGRSLFLYNYLLKDVFGMGLGDIGFKKFSSYLSTTTETKKTIKISESKKTLDLKGENTVTLTLKNADSSNITWKSSDSSIAKVKNGKVTAIKTGKATITATYNGKNYTCKITVKDSSSETTNVKTYPKEDKKLSTYKEVTKIPNVIYNTYGSENGLGGNHYYIKGTVKGIYDTAIELGKALNVNVESPMQCSKFILLSTSKGDVIIADLYSEIVNQYLALWGNNPNTIKNKTEQYERFEAYSKYPKKNESVKILVTYAGYSLVFDLPICYYGINNLVNE